MTCTNSFWWNLAVKHALSRWLPAGWLLLFPAFCQAIEPVFQVEERAIPELLSPERLPPEFYTAVPDEYWQEPIDSYWHAFSNWVLIQERKQGPRVQALGAWADRVLSGSSHSLPNNESYLRLGFAAEIDSTDLPTFEPEFRFRLDVPTARRKLRLVIESESEDQIPLDERLRDRQLTGPERTDSQTTGALRFLTQVGDAINLSTDVGGKLEIPPDAFWRLTANKRWQLNERWTGDLRQRVYYFHQEGWGARTWFGASRWIGKGWEFLASSELEWQHSERKFVGAQLFRARKALNNRSTLIPRVGVLFESQPSWRTTSAFVDLTWRYRVHSDWIFAELVPSVDFPRGNSFSDQASLLFRVEMFFAGTLERRR